MHHMSAIFSGKGDFAFLERAMTGPRQGQRLHKRPFASQGTYTVTTSLVAPSKNGYHGAAKVAKYAGISGFFYFWPKKCFWVPTP